MFLKKFKRKREDEKKKDEKINLLSKSVENLNKILQEGNFIELSYLLGNKKEMFIRNFFAGISRGIGIGVGVTVISAILIIILQKIVTLNIPVIGEYIADIVEIVQRSRWDKGDGGLVFQVKNKLRFFTDCGII